MKIMLDAGHHGDTHNAAPFDTEPKYYESNMNWELHLLLKEELEKRGVTVLTTRKEKADDLGVFERGLMAKGCDLFISLHSNATGSDDPKLEYIDYPLVIYPLLDKGEALAFANVIGKKVQEVMQTKQEYRTWIREYPNRPGIDYYGVIRGAVEAGCKMAFLIEHGFHTNRYCVEWLLDKNNLKKLAAAEAETIVSYFKNGSQQ